MKYQKFTIIMKKLLIALSNLLFCLVAYGQTVDYIEFTYDYAGNRTERHVIYLREPDDSVAQEIEYPVKNAVNTNQTGNENVIYKELLGEQEICIFPNPTKGEITVEITNLQQTAPEKLEVFSLAGESVFSENMLQNKTVVDLSKLPPGTYVLKILLDTKLSTWKIIKE
jgi:hypothetical protein